MKKVLSVLLTTLILAGSTGIAYGQHFCGDFLMKSGFAFNEIALDCGMEELPEDCTGELPSVHASHCCDNHFYQVDFDHHFFGFQLKLKIQPDFFVAVLPTTSFIPFNPTSEHTVQFTGYDPPPLLVEDFQSLYQTFLV